MLRSELIINVKQWTPFRSSTVSTASTRKSALSSTNKNPLPKSAKYEENEIKLKRLEEVFTSLQSNEEKKFSMLKAEINQIKTLHEQNKSSREKLFESSFNELGALETKIEGLVSQNANVG